MGSADDCVEQTRHASHNRPAGFSTNPMVDVEIREEQYELPGDRLRPGCVDNSLQKYFELLLFSRPDIPKQHGFYIRIILFVLAINKAIVS